MENMRRKVSVENEEEKKGATSTKNTRAIKKRKEIGERGTERGCWRNTKRSSEKEKQQQQQQKTRKKLEFPFKS